MGFAALDGRPRLTRAGDHLGRDPVNDVTVISLFAAMLSMTSYVPQAWAIIRSRSTDGLSLKMYLITVAGFVAWLTYGVLIGQWAIIGQNIVCLVLASFILVMKLLPQGKKEAVAEKMTPTAVGAKDR